MKKSAIALTQACDGPVRYKSAVGMSPNTIRNYRTTFAKPQAYFAGVIVRRVVDLVGQVILGESIDGGRLLGGLRCV